MAARVRSVVWAFSAQADLDEVIGYIRQDSPTAAADLLEKTLQAAATLSTFAERGRIVPESDDPAIRELFVFRYRLMYEVRADQVVIVAFLHGARDFRALKQRQSLE